MMCARKVFSIAGPMLAMGENMMLGAVKWMHSPEPVE
jgi:hypothetical protein